MKDGINTKGKLYAKYYNSMRTLKSSGLLPRKESSLKIVSHNRHNKQFGNIFLNYYYLCLAFDLRTL